MIAILLSLLLFIFGLICTISTIPPTKKLLSLCFQSCSSSSSSNNNSNHDTKNPPQDSTKTTPIKAATTTADLRGVFATFDKNNDGYITRQELKESLKNIGISAGETDVADMVEKVDSNGDGLIDFDEFRELFDSISRDGDLKEAFDVFDGNKDGLITVEELGLVLSSLGFNQGNKMEDCKEMIRKVDVDGDGMVNFDEFKMMMKSGLGSMIPVSS